MMMPDVQLLHAFVRDRSDEAFRQLVARHIDRVYSAARRQVHNAHDAEEVTPAVFIVLAQKAVSIRDAALLSAWLLKVTHFVAADFRKAAASRRKLLQEAQA